MNGSCEITEPGLCGCCEGIGTETPEPIFNRPGLSAVAYRVGTQVTFKASLLAALSSSDQPALAGLRTRDDSDFTIALLDAWATCLDILSFYQERIANESYLRTAVDTASVMDLAQLVGYKPSPGVAASAFLAFTLTSAPGSPNNVPIPAGTRVQSVPGPGQTPQVFETSSYLTAVIAQNAIPAQTTIPWGLNPNATSLWVQGTNNNIHVGDAVLFVSQALYNGAASGSTSASGAADFHYVTAVTTDSNSDDTLITWDQPLNWPTSNDNTAYVYVFRKKAALFGVQAPDPRILPTTNNNLGNLTGYPTNGNGDWVFEDGYTSGSFQINLDASYPGTMPQSGQPAWTVLISPDYTALFQITTAADAGPVLYTLTTKVTQLTLANEQVLVNNIQSAANVAKWETALALAINAFVQDLTLGNSTTQDILAIDQASAELALATGTATSDQILADIVSETRSATAYIQSALLTPADPPYFAGSPWSYAGTNYQTQSGLLLPVAGSELQVVTGEQFSNGQPVAISGQRLRLQVTGNVQSDSQAAFLPNGSTSSSTLTDGQVFLIDAFPPTPAANGTDMLWSVITTDGVAGMLQINNANVLLAPADQKNDPMTGETVVISGAPTVSGSVVTLSFGTQSLARIYDRGTVTVNANVVAATQGETMYEILGSGDATNDALQFTLKQSPLTYVPSSTPDSMGASSTLQVWVNNVQWQEVDNFLDSGPSDRVFVTQANASQQTTVQFGDGQDGERTPTGQMNIRAVYRKGIGSAGNVQSGQLTQALDRPQGLSSVTNPSPATGGDDPDTAATARVSAPLHVLTLDRVVSLEDYQNYALAYAGIAQALATWTWVGRMRSVFITVAGANGLVLQTDQPPITNLITALQNAGNPYVPITVDSYTPAYFEVGAYVSIDSEYDSDLVLAQVWQTLSTNFSFPRQQIGQGVAQSQVIALIQSVPGVIGVELNTFNKRGESLSPLPNVLQAASPVMGTQGTPTKGAEILLLDPASQGNFQEWTP